MSEDRKFHYYLVTGNVVIRVGEDIQAIPQNALLVTDDQNLGVHQLGKAQQALQVTFFKKMDDTPQVVDVILFNFTHLGHMTEAEFHARPEGVTVQERAKPSAEIIDISTALNRDG